MKKSEISITVDPKVDRTYYTEIENIYPIENITLFISFFSKIWSIISNHKND